MNKLHIYRLIPLQYDAMRAEEAYVHAKQAMEAEQLRLSTRPVTPEYGDFTTLVSFTETAQDARRIADNAAAALLELSMQCDKREVAQARVLSAKLLQEYP